MAPHRRLRPADRREKAVRDDGFKGLKMYPGCGFYPYDEMCLPFYKKCVEYDVPVLFHTSPVGWEHIALSGDFLWDRAAMSAGRRPLNLGRSRQAA